MNKEEYRKGSLLKFLVDYMLDISPNDRLWLIEKYYEEVAQKTCEFCGNPGELDKRTAWLSIRCEKCE